MSIFSLAQNKTITGVGTMKFEKPVTVFRLAVSAVFFFIQWTVYAVILEGFGATSIINTLLSFAAAATVTYKLFSFLKIFKKENSAGVE